MKFTILLNLALITNISFSAEECPNLLVTESYKITTHMQNTTHDKFYNDHDEISIHYATSNKPLKAGRGLNEDEVYNLGENIAKRSGITSSTTYIRPFGYEKLPDHFLDQSQVYGKFINVMVNDVDAVLNITGTPIDGILYVLQGADPTDHIFVRTLKRNDDIHGSQNFVLKNQHGDILKIDVSPFVVKKMTKTKLQNEYDTLQEETASLTRRLNYLKRFPTKSTTLYIDAMDVEIHNIKSKLLKNTGTLAYYKILLQGKVAGACSN